MDVKETMDYIRHNISKNEELLKVPEIYSTTSRRGTIKRDV